MLLASCAIQGGRLPVVRPTDVILKYDDNHYFILINGIALKSKLKAMLGQLNNSKIEEVLKGQVIGRIGCHADDVTYIVPVSYAYDGQYVYVRSKDGLKVEIMRKSPKVCFEVEAIHDMGNWETVIAWGTFEEISDIEERKAALKKLNDRRLPAVNSELSRLSSQWPFEPADLNKIEGVVYRIELKEKTGRFETQEGANSIVNAYFYPTEEEV